MGLKNIFLTGFLFLLSQSTIADPYPPTWDNGAGTSIHHSPVSWPTEPVNAADCGNNCGQWKPYTRFQNSINDPRSQDDSNGGTAPQNYVNIASSCTDKEQPSIYYYLHQGATEADDVIMFRWRVEQIANTYATGPNAGNFSTSNPWSSALWTVMFDIDGSGYRSLAAHLNGSSGGPGEEIDTLAGIWSSSQKQSIDYINDSTVKLLGHNPTAFIDNATNKILNFNDNNTPTTDWNNGSSETSWDYGTSRAKLVSTRSCNEYFVDYQIPVAMLDASGETDLAGKIGPKITRSTPISMMFCTANSLNNPFQKDCAINKEWAADSNKPAPFGDYISFDKTEPYSQPIIAEVTAIAPVSCGQDYELTAKVQDVLSLNNGVVNSSVKAVDFYYWYDANGSGDADEVDGVWVNAASATLNAGSLNSWSGNWSASSLPKGRYLIGVQAVDDNTLVDDEMIPTGIDNRTFSYVAGDSQSQVYIGGSWISGQEALFPDHSPGQSPIAGENWYGNPEVTGIQTALVGVAINTCGVAPVITVSSSDNEVAPSASVTFTVTVSNAGNTNPITVSNLSNLLPDGFTYQANSTTGDFGTTNPTISSQSLSWNFNPEINIIANGSASLSFIATASTDAGNYNNTSSATTSFGDLASEPVAIAVGSARLALNITPSSYSTSPSGQITYTLNYSNPSTVAITNTTLTHTIPTDTTFQSCSDSCTNGANVSWTIGVLAPGDSGSVSLTLDINSGYSTTSLNTSASLSGTDPSNGSVNKTAQSAIYVNVPVGAIAAFTLDKTASSVQIAPGANITYTLTYNNYGGAAASNVVITDTLPAGMTYSSSSDSGSESAGTVTWNIGSVIAGASASVSVIATADNPFESQNPAVNNAQINWDSGTEVTATVSVGITGLSCSNYYFRDTTTNVGFDGTNRIATITPVPVSGDTGSSVTVTAPTSGSAYLEAVRFYQDPANLIDTNFSGNIDTTLYIDRPNGPGLDLLATLYDYNSTTGATTQLGQQLSQFGGSTKGLLSFSVPLTGTLQKDHRLLWTIEVRSQHNSQTYDVQIQYNGTVSNAISGGTTFANSGAGFCVTPPANLTIDKSVNLATVPENSTTAVSYTINYANHGESSATNTLIIDTLPTGITFTSAELNSAPVPTSGTNPYTFDIGTVTAGASGSLVINASVSNTATGTLVNSAAISSDQTSAITDTASTLVGTPSSGSGGGSTAPELHLSKTANTNLLSANDTVTYTLTVVNTGDAEATNIVVTDDFPEQSYFSYVSCNTAAGTCNESPTGTLNWSAGTLAAGASANLTYQMSVSSTGITSGLNLLANTASANDDDYCTNGSPASCTSETVTVSVSGNADLAVTISADNAAVIPGDTIEYTLTVTNNGSSTANEVNVVNPIPDNTGFIEIISGAGSFDTLNNQVLFNVTNLAAGASNIYSFTAKVISPLTNGDTTITNTVTASAANAESVSNTVNSTATAAAVMSLGVSGNENIPFPATTLTADVTSSTNITVSSSALLSIGDTVRINGTFSKVTAIAGNIITLNIPVTASNGAVVQLAASFSISYQNSGDAAATNVQVSEALPAGWVFVSASPNATSAPAIGSNGTISWTLGTVAAGDSATLQFIALPTTSGSSVHTINLTGDAAITETANITTLVGGLIIQKTINSNNAAPGDNVTYNINVTNSLSSSINGVVVTDVLPAGFTYVSSTVTPSDISDTTRPIWTVNIPASGSINIEFTATISSDVGAATYQNEVEVSAPAGIGISQFDALSSKTEDVTLLVASGLISGDVFYNSKPLAGIWLNFFENNVFTYRVYTDANGHFQRVLEVGSDWRIEISSDSDNDAVLAGLNLTSGTDPETFAITSGDSITRNFIYSLTQPTVNTLSTSDSTPSITGTYPSAAANGVFSVNVNGVTYVLGTDSELVATGDNWTLNIATILSDTTYSVTATITSGDNSRSDATTNELTINTLDTDSDGIFDAEDLDDDNDGIPDILEGDGAIDTDGDGIVDSLDLDSDNDGIFDLVESGAANTDTLDSNNDGQIDSGNAVGSNGIADVIETTTDSGTVTYNGGAALDTDNDGIEDYRDLDSDNDGIPDVIEAGGSDDDGDGVIGTGTPTVDANGLATGSGLTPIDSDGDGTPDYQDNDTDGDGIQNNVDLDDDNDGIPDTLEGNGITDTDGDGIVDSQDLDSDNDGIYDLVESGAANTTTLDTNNDGQIDSSNPVGSNGLTDAIETSIDSGTVDYNGGTPLDTDSDGIEDFRDLDSDNDGIPDVTEAGGDDPDGDGIIGTDTPSVDANGLATGAGLTPIDSDGDGIGDQLELDADNDGIKDLVEAGGVDNNDDGLVDGSTDNNGDGFDDGTTSTPLPLTDSDNDGTPDYQDNDDTDNDGIPDSIDLDDDNDGIPDSLEGDGAVDSDGDGITDNRDLDSDNDGIFDLVESGITTPSTLDSNNDGRIDSTNSPGTNGLADVVETTPDSGIIEYNNGVIIDSDNDGVADFRDLDSDNDGITDVIENGGDDPDGDGVLGTGTPTVNNDGIASGTGLPEVDTDGDGIPDRLDLDSDNDGTSDLIESGGSDNNNDGLVDNFTDNNGDGFDDTISVKVRTLTDTDSDGIPDYLDTTDNSSQAVVRTGVNGIGSLNLLLMLFFMLFLLACRQQSKLSLLLILTLLSFNSQAEDESNTNPRNDYERRWYIGAGIGESLMAPETDGTIYTIDNEDDFGYKIYFGIDMSEYFSAEFSMANLGTTTLQPTGELDYETTSLNLLYYFYDQNENNHEGWASYVKGGLGTINNSANIPYEKENSVQVVIGAGIEYAWNNGFAARLDLESFDDDASLLTVGLLYRFGKKEKPKEEPKEEPKDSDQDGIYDNEDQCPNTATNIEVDNKGCEKDSDKDGVLDSKDQCPETPEGEAVDENGCDPDKDKDGVLNNQDQCPETAKDTKVDTVGCAVFETDIKGINFNVRSADLTDDSKAILDKVAESLIKIPNIHIKIFAHTDSRGKKKANQTLSDQRAKSVVDYLVSQDVSADRMESKGFGETQPTATNDTNEGRAKNRRVEFEVIKKDAVAE